MTISVPHLGIVVREGEGKGEGRRNAGVRGSAAGLQSDTLALLLHASFFLRFIYIFRYSHQECTEGCLQFADRIK